jgi:neurotransmitter:Na+ symporter, NSS family
MVSTRNKFSSKFGFIAAAAGSAVGLGNIWKFPFEVGQNGGAAFLLIYLIFCFVLCYPLLITEIAIGRSAQKSPVGAFKSIHHPKWTFMGILGVLAGVLILSFYTIVTAWVFGYFVEMLLGNFRVGDQFAEFIKDIEMVGGYSLFILAVVAFIVARGVTRGIEKASKLLMPVLILILFFLIFYSLTLDNAMEGIKFYLVPDFSKINVEVIYRALGQAFFSLSLGMGILITYGSYLKKREDIIFSGAVITLADIGIAFLSGLMIFPIVFSQNISTDGGAGLIFITMPGIFETMGPGWGIFIGALFFLLLAFAAITSIISLLEIPVSYLVDQHDIKRDYAVWISAGIIFLIAIPSLLGGGYSDFFSRFITYYRTEEPVDFMTFLTDVSSNTLLPFVGLLTSLFAIYVWKRKKLFAELSHGSEGFNPSWLSVYVGFCLQYIAPVVLGITFVVTILEIFFGINLFS